MSVWQRHLALGDGFDASAFVADLHVDDAEHARIASLRQGTTEWRESRFGRLTASNFGAAARHHHAGAFDCLLATMLWPEDARLEGRAAKFAEWGTVHEPVARDVYEAYRRRRIEAARPGCSESGLAVYETGLLVSKEYGYLGASPDFLVEEDDAVHEEEVLSGAAVAVAANVHHARPPYLIWHSVKQLNDVAGTDALKERGVAEGDLYSVPAKYCTLAWRAEQQRAAAGGGAVSQTGARRRLLGCGEVKCPAMRKLYSAAPKHAEHGFPKYYYDQIQGLMALNGLPWCDVVVYTPRCTEVTRFGRNEAYWHHTLFPAVKAFYFSVFLPRLALRAAGKLAAGQIHPPLAPAPCLSDLLALARRDGSDSHDSDSCDEVEVA